MKLQALQLLAVLAFLFFVVSPAQAQVLYNPGQRLLNKDSSSARAPVPSLSNDTTKVAPCSQTSRKN